LNDFPEFVESVRHTLERIGVHPAKKLGQNFLTDGNWIRKTVESLPARTPVVEIGPGTGSLTAPLLQRGHPVTAVEVDGRLCQFLRDRFKGLDFTLLEGDAVNHPLAGFRPTGTRFVLLANLPFAITSPWLDSLLRPGNSLPEQLFLILQKEGFDRTTASPKSRAYGPTAIRVQLAFEYPRSQPVPHAAFFPAPGVESRFAVWKKKAKPRLLSPEAASELRRIFGHRRKMLRHSFRSLPPVEQARRTEILAREGLDPTVRPEEIAPEVWYRLLPGGR